MMKKSAGEMALFFAFVSPTEKSRLRWLKQSIKYSFRGNYLFERSHIIFRYVAREREIDGERAQKGTNVIGFQKHELPIRGHYEEQVVHLHTHLVEADFVSHINHPLEIAIAPNKQNDFLCTQVGNVLRRRIPSAISCSVGV